MIKTIECENCLERYKRDYYIETEYYHKEALCQWCGKVGALEVKLHKK